MNFIRNCRLCVADKLPIISEIIDFSFHAFFVLNVANDLPLILSTSFV